MISIFSIIKFTIFQIILVVFLIYLEKLKNVLSKYCYFLFYFFRDITTEITRTEDIIEQNVSKKEKEEKIIISERIENRPETAKKPFQLERNNFKPHASSNAKKSEKRALSASIIKKYALIYLFLFFVGIFQKKTLYID